jgi:hypothetical protein
MKLISLLKSQTRPLTYQNHERSINRDLINLASSCEYDAYSFTTLHSLPHSKTITEHTLCCFDELPLHTSIISSSKTDFSCDLHAHALGAVMGGIIRQCDSSVRWYLSWWDDVFIECKAERFSRRWNVRFVTDADRSHEVLEIQEMVLGNDLGDVSSDGRNVKMSAKLIGSVFLLWLPSWDHFNKIS